MFNKVILHTLVAACLLAPSNAVHDDETQTPCESEGCSGRPIGTYPIPSLWLDHPNIHWRCTSPSKVALTFDDGPSLNTPDVLDILDNLQVHATFFVNGRNIWSATYGDMLTRAEASGHMVASHTYSHEPMAGKTDEEVEAFLVGEVDKNEEVTAPYLPIYGLQKYMRPPKLEMDESMASKLADRGYTVVQINIDTNDWQDRTTDDMVNDVKDNTANTAQTVATNSYITLQHDTTERTNDVISPVVTWFRENGYELVTIDECLGMTLPPTTDAPTLSPDKTAEPTTSAGCSGDPCEDTTQCRSQYGYCGDTAGHCDDKAVWTPACLATSSPTKATNAPTKSSDPPSTSTTPSPSTSISTSPTPLMEAPDCSGAPCTAGACRSKYGFCGDSEDHCNSETIWVVACGGGGKIEDGTGKNTTDTGDASLVSSSTVGSLIIALCASAWAW